MPVLTRAIAIARIGVAAVTLAVLCSAGIVAVLLGMRGHRAVRLILPMWARMMLRICGLNVEVLRGAEFLRPDGPCIFVANHQGLLDAIVFPAILDAPMFYPLKKEAVWMPFIGWFAWITGQPRIDRKDPVRAIQAMDATAGLLRAGICTLMFPEGTRTRDGKLGPFKRGAFRLSMDTGLPIVAITLIDSYDRMPMGTYALTPGTIHVVVDSPVPTADWNRKNVVARVGELRQRFLSNLTEERTRLGLPDWGGRDEEYEGE